MISTKRRPVLVLITLVGLLAVLAAAEDIELAGTLVLEGVVFESGSAELAADSIEHLDRVAELVLAAGKARLEVGGHTDSSGPADLNRELSRRRAETVRAYLVMRGVAAERVVAVGYGEAYPIADNATSEGRARNRRVELKRLEP